MKPFEHAHAAEIAHLLAERDAARLAAEEAERHRDELLSRVGHDLRGPLNSISGWLQLLQSGHLDPARHQHALDAIARGIRAQTSLLDEMQAVSRALRKRLDLDIAIVELAVPVQRAIDAVRPAATGKSIAMHAAIEPDIVVRGDVEQLTELVRRLLDNAVRCTPDNGRIDVRLDVAGQTAVVAVRDTGIGISPQHLDLIFKPFRMSADRRAAKRGGLGAGLAIARHVAELHGGRIEARSDGPGLGAEFVVTLPRAQRTTSDPHCESTHTLTEVNGTAARRHEAAASRAI